MIEFNKKNENPFAGLHACLQLFQNVINENVLDEAYSEVSDSKEKRDMFFSLLFSIGDVTNRQHNIFKGKDVDSGGMSNREAFSIIMDWMKSKHYDQFIEFMNAGLFDEYTCFDNLFKARVRTYPGTRTIAHYTNVFSDSQYCVDLMQYVISIINGNNPFKKMLVAKFLTIPRLGKRAKHNRMLPETKKIMVDKAAFLVALSVHMGWEYQRNGKVTFNGYRTWRKQYNSDLESVLFSTGKILEFDEVSFLNWYEKLPAKARERVNHRVYSNNKWNKFVEWIETWKKYKSDAQAKERALTEKVRQGLATEEDKALLEKVKKEAKVNVGATTFSSLFDDVLNDRIDPLVLESFANTVNLPFNFLTIVDESGSMRGRPFNFATFLASMLLIKNPDDTARNLIGMFSNDARFISAITKRSDDVTNEFWHRSSVTTIKPEPFVDPKLSVYDNYKRISNCLHAEFRGGGTHISSLAQRIVEISENHPETTDALKQYPVWCILSDGDLNNSYNAKQSILEFQEICRTHLGFVPFIVMIEIYNYNNYDINHFDGVDQFMYIPGIPELIEQMLTNFKDMEVFDVYTPLLSLYRSNRYEPVRRLVK